MEQKLDELLVSVAELKETQETSKLEMGWRLNQLEKDISAKQDQTTEHMVKKLKKGSSMKLNEKETRGSFSSMMS